ncbi:M56 family peptidase [Cryobacterium sp. TMT2-10]|uniref:M56 family metallopeptidase n=1 Tax=Cryobacterium sp. TMT2-10 TaxID=1259244 RepID=UPI00106A02A5|nr:M56 family metallopeptidase [Cryobacterium sp. TMT2-10]TFD40546.1 M56 family peptidase [Cryobacterium sp. TMT2-10]
MLVTAIGLMVVAVALAGPIPILLAGARWPVGSPVLALTLWQSIALAGGLSMIGSLLAFGLLPFGSDLPGGIRSLAGHLGAGTLPAGTTLTSVLMLCGALILGGHLLLNLAATFFRAERQHRRHHHLIGLLSHPVPDRPGMHVIDHDAPVAYCLPGAARSATVLSMGLLRLLDEDQLRGVIEHERAHLLQQHHLVLLAFKSWHSSLPWFPIANRAENAVALLVEMLADDRARRVVPDRTLATAIALVGSAHQVDPLGGDVVPGGGPDHPFDLVTPRVRRLLTPPPALPLPVVVAAVTCSASLLVLPTLLLFAA